MSFAVGLRQKIKAWIGVRANLKRSLRYGFPKRENWMGPMTGRLACGVRVGAIVEETLEAEEALFVEVEGEVGRGEAEEEDQQAREEDDSGFIRVR
ncbi:MAG TPA: hypothetical protein VIJ38_09930 [Acidobacteriaceae bacterium]